MTTSSEGVSRSFTEFYLDESISGHIFLKPSIFVGKSYERIFSDVLVNGCDAVIEVITRIVLFFILPVIALLSALFIPIGLLCKGVSCLVCPPLPKQKPPNVSLNPDPFSAPPKPKPKKEEYLGGRVTIQSPYLSTSTGTVPTMPASPAKFPSSAKQKETEIAKQLIAASDTLDTVDQLLSSVKFSKIDIDVIEEAKKLLTENKEISLLLAEPPVKDNPHDPLAQFSERYTVTQCRITSFEHHHDFKSKNINENGEILVADNGDCLFAAFAEHSELNDSIAVANEASIGLERQATVEWILTNYGTDAELQRRLVNSMAEHYHTKIEKLESEQVSLGQMLADSSLLTESQVTANKQRQEAIPSEIELLYIEIIPKLGEAFGENFSGICFDAAVSLVPGYLEEMSQKGEHGGSAELYALCTRHNACAKIHKKEGSSISKTPYETLHPEFETADRPARHFTHTHNHYNPYFPPSA